MTETNKINLKEVFSSFARSLTSTDPQASAPAEALLDAAFGSIYNFDAYRNMLGGCLSSFWPWDVCPPEQVPAMMAIFLSGHLFLDYVAYFRKPTKEAVRNFCAEYCRNPNVEVPLRVQEISVDGDERYSMKHVCWHLDLQTIVEFLFLFFGEDRMYEIYEPKRIPYSIGDDDLWTTALLRSHVALDLEGNVYVSLPPLKEVLDYLMYGSVLKDTGFRISLCNKDNPPIDYDLKINIDEWDKFLDDSDPDEEDEDESDS